MKSEPQTYFLKTRRDINRWAVTHPFGIFLFGVISSLLVLLKSTGYFYPFYQLTVNSIVLISIIISVPLLGIKSRTVFITGILFLIIACIFKIYGVDIWAERTSFYVFELLLIGTILLVFEDVKKRRSSVSD